MKNRMILAAIAALPCLLRADEVADAGRKLAETKAASILQIEGVVEISIEGKLAGMAGGNQEQKSEALGTVIDKSGLILVSDGILNPAKMMKPMSVNVGGEQQTITVSGQLKEVRIKLPDGTEFPGRVLLTDDDLDLAFVVPEKALTPEQSARLVPLELGAGTAKPALLDYILSVTRLSREMNSEVSIRPGRVLATLTKPRTAWLGANDVGAPVYNLGGDLLGFTLVRRDGATSTSEMRPGAMQMGARAEPVLIPLSDILPVVEQAREEAAKKAAKGE